MRKMVAVIAALFVLTGCTTEPANTSESVEPAVSVQEGTSKSELPLQAPDAPEPTDEEATYLFELRKRTDVQVVVDASDEQLLEAGNMACDQLRVNPSMSEVRVVENEEPLESGSYIVSAVVGTHAQMYLCPEVEFTR